MIIEFFDRDDSVFALHLAGPPLGDELCIEVEDRYFYPSEEQALQIAAHLQRWARRNERGESNE